MGMFKTEGPRPFQHNYIYYDARKEKLKKIEERAKRELGMLPQETYTAADRIRGKFHECSKHLKKREESGREPMKLSRMLIIIAVLLYILYVLVTGRLMF